MTVRLNSVTVGFSNAAIRQNFWLGFPGSPLNDVSRHKVHPYVVGHSAADTLE